jgi:hypothetical protein
MAKPGSAYVYFNKLELQNVRSFGPCCMEALRGVS